MVAVVIDDTWYFLISGAINQADTWVENQPAALWVQPRELSLFLGSNIPATRLIDIVMHPQHAYTLLSLSFPPKYHNGITAVQSNVTTAIEEM